MADKTDSLALPDAFRTLAESVKDALVTREPEKLAAAFRFLGTLEARTRQMAGMVKDALKEHIQQAGTEVGAKGSREVVIGNMRYPMRAQTAAGTLDDAKVWAKLHARNLDPNSFMDVTISHKANRQKLARLVTAGQWTEQDFKDCEVERKWALYAPEKVEETNE